MTKRGFMCVLVAVLSVLVLSAVGASILLGGEAAKAPALADTISKSLTACCNRYVRGMNLENDPIDYGTGELVLKAVDFHETSPRLDFALVRTYRSRTMPGGSFGPGWAFSLDVSVSPADGGYVMLNDDGDSIKFTRSEGDAAYRPVGKKDGELKVLGEAVGDWGGDWGHTT